jgi:hypothetical protein
MVNLDHIFFGNPCPQSIRITTYQSAYILWRAAEKSRIFPTNTFSPRHYYKTRGQSETAHVRQRIKIRIWHEYIIQWAYYAFNFTLFDKARQTFSIFSSTSYPNLTKILFICPWVMFKVALIFVLIRLIFLVILLTCKQQMLDIYMHACSTVELFT